MRRGREGHWHERRGRLGRGDGRRRAGAATSVHRRHIFHHPIGGEGEEKGRGQKRIGLRGDAGKARTLYSVPPTGKGKARRGRWARCCIIIRVRVRDIRNYDALYLDYRRTGHLPTHTQQAWWLGCSCLRLLSQRPIFLSYFSLLESRKIAPQQPSRARLLQKFLFLSEFA